MGQINLPVLNRVGYSSFWESLWENYYSYSKEFNKNLFFKKILILLLNDRIIYGNYFYSKKLNNFIFKKSTFLVSFDKNYNFFFESITSKNLPFFYSKLWYIKYQNWLLVSLFIYNILNKLKHKENNFVTNRINIFNKYYNFLYFLNKSFLNSYLYSTKFSNKFN